LREIEFVAAGSKDPAVFVCGDKSKTVPCTCQNRAINQDLTTLILKPDEFHFGWLG
jgi:hypothetical protein